MEEAVRIAPPRNTATTVRVPGLLASLLELARRRELLWHMTVRHLRGQYKQSVLGYAWALVNPLSQMLILSFVFSTLLRVSSQGIPFPLFVFVGLLPWIFFSGAVSAATDSVAGAISLVTKVYFPREILPIAAILTKVVDLAFGSLILVGLMVWYQHTPTETALWLPVLFFIHFVFTMGIALPLAALNLFFHDVRYLVGVALTMWFYLTPVIYSVDAVPQKYRVIFDINPNALFINAYRRVLLTDVSPGAERLLLGMGVAFAAFFIGYFLFKKMESGFADRI